MVTAHHLIPNRAQLAQAKCQQTVRGFHLGDGAAEFLFDVHESRVAA